MGMNLGMNLGRAAGPGVVDICICTCCRGWIGDSNFMTSRVDARAPGRLEDQYERLPKALARSRTRCAAIECKFKRFGRTGVATVDLELT